jgi:hypothetical protein
MKARAIDGKKLGENFALKQVVDSLKGRDIGLIRTSSSGKKLKKGGKVSSGYKCSHNRLY